MDIDKLLEAIIIKYLIKLKLPFQILRSINQSRIYQFIQIRSKKLPSSLVYQKQEEKSNLSEQYPQQAQEKESQEAYAQSMQRQIIKQNLNQNNNDKGLKNQKASQKTWLNNQIYNYRPRKKFLIRFNHKQQLKWKRLTNNSMKFLKCFNSDFLNISIHLKTLRKELIITSRNLKTQDQQLSIPKEDESEQQQEINMKQTNFIQSYQTSFLRKLQAIQTLKEQLIIRSLQLLFFKLENTFYEKQDPLGQYLFQLFPLKGDQHIIQDIPNDKSADPDGFKGELLKYGGQHLTLILHSEQHGETQKNSIEIKYFNLIPFFKKGNKED